MKNNFWNAVNQVKKQFVKEKDESNDFPQDNFVIITLDSLRYDVAASADTPNIKKFFKQNNVDWVKTGAHGTYTLISHISLFHVGTFPCDNRSDIPAPYNRKKEKLFQAKLAWNQSRKVPVRYPTPDAPNIVKGFEQLGYRTIGIGGVNWFSTEFATSNFWKDNYFSEFYWKPEYTPQSNTSLELQVELIKSLDLKASENPIFLFLNISCTHTPYMGFGKSIQGQTKSLEYVDTLFPELLEGLPEKYHMLFLADHGDCFGEDGLWGHGFYHPKVMEVPFASIDVGY